MDKDKILKNVREIALKNAKIILLEAEINKNDIHYSQYLYDMQFKIYHELKRCLNIDTE